MKVKLEAIKPGINSSFAILLTPKLNEIFYWHFHPEYEIVYVEAETGVRHVGDHISKYEGSDLVFIGPNIPHLNFDYGVKTIAETVVIQMKEYFLGQTFFALPEIAAIKDLFERAKGGIAFFGETKRIVGEKLKQIEAFRIFSNSSYYSRYFNSSLPVKNICLCKQGRLQMLLY
jgi:hypothetical protein